MDKNMTLDDYRKLVEQIMRDAIAGSGEHARSFSNTGTAHARIVADTMLSFAQASFSIHCDHLDRDVWDPKQIRSFLNRVPSARIRVLVLDAAVEASALNDVQDFVTSGRIEVRKLPSDEGFKPPHIAVADGRHSRIERETEHRRAVVAFGNEPLGRSVEDLFDALWEDGMLIN